MVRKPITEAGDTSNPTAAYTPRVITKSWISAIRAAAAIFQVRKYSEITPATRIKNTIRPCRAFRDTSSPQDGPTNDEVTLDWGTS